jgi:hypothetical protein
MVNNSMEQRASREDEAIELYGIPIFIAVLRTVHHWTLYCAI